MTAPESDRYGLVLLLLVSSYLLTAFVADDQARILPLLLYVAALLLVLRGTRLRRPRLLWGLLVGSAVVGAAALATRNRVVHGLVVLWLAVVLSVGIVTVVRRVLLHRVVTLQTIFGALSVYLLIGFFYAALFAAVAHFQRAALFTGGQPANSTTIQYFSFITMTTVGYGDFTAAGEPARTLAVLDALTGQIFLVTLVARLVSSFGSARDE